MQSVHRILSHVLVQNPESITSLREESFSRNPPCARPHTAYQSRALIAAAADSALNIQIALFGPLADGQRTEEKEDSNPEFDIAGARGITRFHGTPQCL